MAKDRYFSELLPELATRASRATVSRLGFSNTALRRHLDKVFSRSYGEPGAFLGDPVFEATFGWEAADVTLDELSSHLLHKDTVDALDNPSDGKMSDYRLARTINPYKHQLNAWQVLLKEKPQSVVVTSGTGSGKTECFMVPILSQLAKEAETSHKPLEGVRALFLYPLNALIQSQRDRLHAWTAAYDGKVRFCLYNGNTPEREPQSRRNETPNQVIDREVLRESPSPVLVTNATMLEYMLVRAQDAPIIEKSEGQLQWIVLDEAHTYMGSQAAELSLLLRRVLHAFKVKPDNVRFVATSATIGDKSGNAAESLRTFLASMAGVDPQNVHVISGQRCIPSLVERNEGYVDSRFADLKELVDEPEQLYAALSANTTAKMIRNLFVSKEGSTTANTLCSIASHLVEEKDRHDPAAYQYVLEWLDLLGEASIKDTQGVINYLPLRAHLFHNVLPGLWACADRNCTDIKGTELEADEWPFGMVYTEERRHCKCGSPVYEIKSCNDCNTTFLSGRIVSRKGKYRLVQSQEEAGDEFTLDMELPEDEIDEAEIIEGENPVLIANGHLQGTGEVEIDRRTLDMDPADTSDTLTLRVKEESATENNLSALVCPECGGHHGHGKYMFRMAILGAPFLLGEIVPTLLEFCPDGDKPLDKPMRGRRMITFTDSRQGTARIAAKLQQDSERSRLRGLVYRRCISSSVRENNEDSGEYKKLEDLRRAYQQAPSPMLAEIIQKEEEKLSAGNEPKPQGFDELAHWISTNERDIRDWMHEYYSEQYPAEFSGNNGAEKLGKMLITREFARRPKRLNSLETMGLVSVQYPGLEKVKAPVIAGVNLGITLEEWRDFLKVCLDFHVRENTFIALPESWRKWGGNRLSAKILLPPTSKEEQTNRNKRWPQCNVRGAQGRLVRLLSYVYKLDPKSDSGRDMIDAILRKAWDDLVAAGILQSADIGRNLDLRQMSFSVIPKGWVCPVTRRILDVAFKGVTPYLPTHAVTDKVALCREVEMPVCDIVGNDFDSYDDMVHAIRDWINENNSVMALRDEGLWSDLSDRIVEGGTYFRAAEHSAQQSGLRLEEYEKQFKTGRLNLLSCSTTMEMGVDIGGISNVAMNNVPPHPANYLQRAGRAGRRSEARSVALTVCKNNPHDQHVFTNTMWPFITSLPAPSISLSSAVIVQRHINSMMLAYFLRKKTGKDGDLHKLNMEWWMLPLDDSLCDQFEAWASCFDESKQIELAEGLRSLTKHTCYDGIAQLNGLTEECASEMSMFRKNWVVEYGAIESQIEKFTGKNKESTPAFRVLNIQKNRLMREYLLRELASGGFLPGYGFPTNIASFETLTIDELEKRKRKDKGGREDNLYRRRELPSRDTVTALREYAPGSEIVIDGQVYKSSGITLNWHAPASIQEVREIQNIREAWRCRSCGSSGTHIPGIQTTSCPDCGSAFKISDENNFSYLQPSGFSVDLYESPHNDVTSQKFIPVELPWVNMDEEWYPMQNPRLGRYRASNNGTVFYYSAGEYGKGYAVCLECGRTEPMSISDDDDEAQLPEIFRKPHKRLRGSQGGETAICDGSDKSFAIKPNLRLGFEMVTDVLEIELFALSGKPLQSHTVAYTLAVAIRRAMASILGIEVTELGADTKPVRVGEEKHQVIVIYDMSSSGYCTSVADHMAEVLRKAKAILECPAECDQACQHCVLSYDTRFRIDDLDRYATLEFITDAWMDGMALQEEEALFGVKNSYMETQSLAEAITRIWNKPDSDELRLYLTAEPNEWDISISPLRKCVQKWSVNGRKVLLVINQEDISTLSKADRYILNMLSSLDGVSVHYGSPPASVSGAYVVAECTSGDSYLAWATRDIKLGLPNTGWGENQSGFLVKGVVEKQGELGDLVLLDDDSPDELPDKTLTIEIKNDVDGRAYGFGDRLLQTIINQSSEEILAAEDEVVAIEYMDRYLVSPLPTVLFARFISSLKEYYGTSWKVGHVSVVTEGIKDSKTYARQPKKIFHNWRKTEERNAALVKAFEGIGVKCAITIRDKKEIPHARQLLLKMSKGKAVRMWLDQGFSYWGTPHVKPIFHQAKGINFNFRQSAEKQGMAILESNAVIESQVFCTYIFVNKS